jgi:c-di-GMP-binding flagellar brake protein YcgR
MKERRTAHRYKVLLPVALHLLAKPKALEPVRARMRDVSTDGLYFTSDRRFAVGTRFGFSLTLPIKTISGGDVMIDAQARVVRVERSPDNEVQRVGIAALIEKYNIVRPKSGSG